MADTSAKHDPCVMCGTTVFDGMRMSIAGVGPYCIDCAHSGKKSLEDAATLAEIRAILAEPVREVVEDSFPKPGCLQAVMLHESQWKRLHELLGGDSDG